MTQPAPLPAIGASAPIGRERYRPLYHFTPRRNWMNDPNGLVFFEGEYHLFYQYNPHGIDWGHMSWGHAVSADLLTWEELPVAIPETDQMIFSGCCVIDWHNISGLSDGTVPPMLAYFTAHDDVAKQQTQHLAYSLDRGRSFTHYAHNPIIDLGLEHFRDPKVFWHGESGHWIMAVALPREHEVQFYRSVDLLTWKFASAFGPVGATGGQWECPDIFPVPVEGHPGERHWVLKVDVDDKFVDGGSGAQYFIGDFDGTHFTIDPERGSREGDLVDYGPDFYAAVSWADLPPEQPGPVWVGWMSNHQTGKEYPTDPWRGAQSLPRRLFLFEEGTRLKLGQRPLAQAETAMPSAAADLLSMVDGGNRAMLASPTSAFSQRIALPCAPATACSLTLMDGPARLLSIDIDCSSRRIGFRRHAAKGLANGFARHTSCNMMLGEHVTLDVYFDGYLAEIFIDGGVRVYSACLFPQGPVSIDLECVRAGAAIS